jgi:acyl-CoA synthetase (AMP-forming)/AMP-acid ligase II
MTTGDHPVVAAQAAWPPGLPETPYAALLLAEQRWGADHGVFEFPDHGTTLTVGELRVAAQQWASGLTHAGVARGDRVAVCLPGDPLWPVLQVACSQIGATIVGVNVKYRRWELERFISIVRPRIVVTAVEWDDDSCGPALIELARAEALGLLVVDKPLEGALLADDVLMRSAPGPVPAVRGSDVGLIQFTSGSTGAPKAAVHTFAQVMLSAHRIVEMAGYDESDVLFSALPFYHVGGSVCTGPVALLSGATTVIPQRFSATGSVRTMAARGCTATQGHAAMFTMQIEQARADGVLGELRLRKGWVAAPPEVVQRIHSELGMDLVVPAYGMSECGMAIGCRTSDPLHKRLTTLGRPMPGVEVRLGEGGNEAGSGELELKGPCVMSGYLGDAEGTASALTADGFLRTGDLVTRDDDGYLVFVDRLKDMIKPGGENVSTSEVERYLLSLPHVTSASVVGVPDPVMGEVPAAFVQVDDDELVPETLLDWCRRDIATFKVPAWIEVVADLPLMASGKVDKSAIRQLALTRTTSPPGSRGASA